MTTKSRRARLGELALLGAAALVSLVVGEIAVRLTGVADPRPTGYAPINTGIKSGAYPTNAIGYRDVERTIAKPPGVRRVVSLGDSFAWGASIEYDDTYAQRVERVLNRRAGGRERWEVAQLALSGMNTVEQASQLIDEGFAYQPDAVVLGFVLNDSEDENAAEARRVQDWIEYKRQRKARRGWQDSSALLRLVRGRLFATIENRRRIEAYRSQYEPNYSGWIACQKALRLMGGTCREKGVPLVVLVFPLFGNPLDDAYPFTAIHAKVVHAASEAGAKVVDLLPYYRGVRWEFLVVNGAEDEHPNEIAHRIASHALLAALDEVLAAAPSPGVAPAPPSAAASQSPGR